MSLGLQREDDRLLASSRGAVHMLLALVVAAFAVLELAYLRDDFDYALVAGNSSTTTLPLYKLTALWSTQAGSLLLWLLVLSALSSLAVRFGNRRFPQLTPVATAVLLGVAAFFAFLLVGLESPFTRSPVELVDGHGLQPLLRYPLMAAHPVALYVGYAGFAVPFAFAVAALVTARSAPLRSTNHPQQPAAAMLDPPLPSIPLSGEAGS